MRINEMLNKKTYIGDIEPNPKEFGIWIKNDGSHMIYDYANREWICNCSGNSKVLYYKVAAGVNIREFMSNTAGIKIFDTIDNRFEYVPSCYMIDPDLSQAVAPNFSFETDEYCIVYLPINAMMQRFDGEIVHAVSSTLEDLFVGLTGQEMPAGITRITEEEYWDDTVPSVFYIVNRNEEKVAFRYDEGMTLGDWVNSDYNSIGLYHITEYDLWNATNANFGASDKEYDACTMSIEDTNGEITYDVLPTFPIQNSMTISLLIVGQPKKLNHL